MHFNLNMNVTKPPKDDDKEEKKVVEKVVEKKPVITVKKDLNKQLDRNHNTILGLQGGMK